MLSAGLGVACWGMCDMEHIVQVENTGFQGCIWWKLLSMLGELIKEVMGIVDGSTWDITKDYCEEAGYGSGFSFSMDSTDD